MVYQQRAEADNLYLDYLITLTSIILDITETETNDCFITHWKEKLESCFCFFTDCKQHKARDIDMITLRNYALQLYMKWLPVTLSVVDTTIV